MSDIDINRVLAQMKTMSIEAGNNVKEVDRTTDFSALLKQSINKVNETQQHAGTLKKAFEMGDPDTSLSEVMVSLQKASISFQAMVQVRNKLVEAYKDVMNTPM